MSMSQTDLAWFMMAGYQASLEDEILNQLKGSRVRLTHLSLAP